MMNIDYEAALIELDEREAEIRRNLPQLKNQLTPRACKRKEASFTRELDRIKKRRQVLLQWMKEEE